VNTELACTKKRKYKTKELATIAGAYQELRTPNKLRVYQCPRCNQWHLTKTDHAFKKAGIL